jgi:thymidylate synthase (FAD)
MKVELMSITPKCEKVIEEAGRTCYKSKIGDRTIIQRWIKAGHLSLLEHASVTFRISEVSRALTHQLVRHRTASFSQQSQRYVKEDGFDFLIPDSIKTHPNELVLASYLAIMEAIQNTYNEYIKDGIPKEDARFILPNACYTEIVVTFDFRNLRHFFELRLDKHSQWEIRVLAGKMLDIVKEFAPNCFFDIEKGEI